VASALAALGTVQRFREGEVVPPAELAFSMRLLRALAIATGERDLAGRLADGASALTDGDMTSLSKLVLRLVEDAGLHRTLESKDVVP
jgi:hypothetical protein